MGVPEYAIISYDTAGREGGLSTRCTITRGGGGGGGGDYRCTITEASRLVLFLLCNSFFLLKSAHFRCTVVPSYKANLGEWKIWPY